MTALAADMFRLAHEVGERHGVELEMRIGMASGPIMAGVVGKSKYSYDVWGAAVNLAARLEHVGTPGCVVVTGDIKVALQDDHKFERAGTVELKGFGKVPIWRMDCGGAVPVRETR
jgi:guanylate cyclase